MQHDVSLSYALMMISHELRQWIASHKAQIGALPVHGWTQEEHDAYHQQKIDVAEQAQRWVLWREMEINPD